MVFNHETSLSKNFLKDGTHFYKDEIIAKDLKNQLEDFKPVLYDMS